MPFSDMWKQKFNCRTKLFIEKPTLFNWLNFFIFYQSNFYKNICWNSMKMNKFLIAYFFIDIRIFLNYNLSTLKKYEKYIKISDYRII